MSSSESEARRLIVVSDELARGGGSPRSQLEIARALAERGVEIVFLHARTGPLFDEWVAMASATRRIALHEPRGVARLAGAARLARNGAAALRVAIGLGRRASEVVLARGHEEIFSAACVARLRGAPLVLHLSSLPPTLPIDACERGDRFGLRSATRAVAVAEHVATAWADRGLPRARIDVIPTGLDPTVWRPDPAGGAALRATLGIAADEPVVLYLGRFDPAKGLLLLADAFAALARSRHRARLVAVGVGEDRRRDEHQIVAELRRRVGGGRLIVQPAVRDPRPWYALADAVVVPSLFAEPFSRVLLEALACGRPVVASAIGGNVEAMVGDLAGWLYPPTSREALRATIERLLDRGVEDPALATRCRDVVISRFSLDRAAQSMLGVFRRAIRERNGESPTESAAARASDGSRQR